MFSMSLLEISKDSYAKICQAKLNQAETKSSYTSKLISIFFPEFNNSLHPSTGTGQEATKPDWRVRVCVRDYRGLNG